MLSPLALLLVVQVDGWAASPAHPTVGDTVWLERRISVPAGWRVRAGKLDPTQEVEPLAEPAILRAPDGWLVRYPVVAWTPGTHTLTLPPIWRLAPDGRADSLPGGAAGLEVRSVIPDSVQRPQPKSAIDPLRSDHRDPFPLLAAVLAAAGALVAGIAWRRRAPRPVALGPPVPLEPEVPDSRWLVAGEPRAVAARASHRLRAALAHAVPGAHEALSTSECLAAVERLPDAPLRDLADVLTQLDQVAFASAHGTDVAALAARARSLVGELAS